MNLKLKLNIRLWISVIMVTGMVFVAEISGEKEIIFPEILALTIGAWLAESQVWEVSRVKMIILMSISAFLGYSMSAFIDIPIFFKIIVCFLFCGLSLIVTRCTMLPMISACILPILMGTKSILYPVSVVVMTAIIITVQWIFEKCKLITPKKHTPIVYDRKTEILRWIFLFSGVAILSAIATNLNVMFIIAPPLIVAFCEFSYVDSKARKSPTAIFFFVAFCACFGACARIVLCLFLNIPITLAVMIVVALVLYSMVFLGKMFPPAGALAVLPFIIDNTMLLLYPLEVIGGGMIFIAMSMIFGICIEKEKIKK